MNFSDWAEDAGEADDAAEEIREGSMPPSQYTQLHPAARLSDDEEALLVAALEELEEGGDSSGRGRGAWPGW